MHFYFNLKCKNLHFWIFLKKNPKTISIVGCARNPLPPCLRQCTAGPLPGMWRKSHRSLQTTFWAEMELKLPSKSMIRPQPGAFSRNSDLKQHRNVWGTGWMRWLWDPLRWGRTILIATSHQRTQQPYHLQSTTFRLMVLFAQTAIRLLWSKPKNKVAVCRWNLFLSLSPCQVIWSLF